MFSPLYVMTEDDKEQPYDVAVSLIEDSYETAEKIFEDAKRVINAVHNKMRITKLNQRIDLILKDYVRKERTDRRVNEEKVYKSWVTFVKSHLRLTPFSLNEVLSEKLFFRYEKMCKLPVETKVSKASSILSKDIRRRKRKCEMTEDDYRRQHKKIPITDINDWIPFKRFRRIVQSEMSSITENSQLSPDVVKNLHKIMTEHLLKTFKKAIAIVESQRRKTVTRDTLQVLSTLSSG